MLCLRTLNCLELVLVSELERPPSAVGSSDPAIDTASDLELISVGISGKPSIFRRSETFIRAVDSPTESPSYTNNTEGLLILIKIVSNVAYVSGQCMMEFSEIESFLVVSYRWMCISKAPASSRLSNLVAQFLGNCQMPLVVVNCSREVSQESIRVSKTITCLCLNGSFS